MLKRLSAWLAQRERDHERAKLLAERREADQWREYYKSREPVIAGRLACLSRLDREAACGGPLYVNRPASDWTAIDLDGAKSTRTPRFVFMTGNRDAVPHEPNGRRFRVVEDDCGVPHDWPGFNNVPHKKAPQQYGRSEFIRCVTERAE